MKLTGRVPAWIVTGMLLFAIAGRVVLMVISDPVYFGTSDFTVFYVAAHFALEHQPIYSNPDLFDAVIALRQAKGAVRYLYPPVALLWFLALIWLPFSGAYWTWFGIQVLMIICILWGVFKLSHTPVKNWALAGSLGVVLLFTPLFTSLRTGQVNILLATLLVALVLLLKQKYQRWAAVVLAGMIFIKLYPVVFIVYFLIKKQYRLVLYTLGALIIWLGVSTLIFGIEPHLTYVKKIPGRAVAGIDTHSLGRYDNLSWNGVVYRLLILKPKTNPFIQSTAEEFWSAAERMKEVYLNNEIFLKGDKAQLVQWVRWGAVLPVSFLVLFFTWKNRRRPIDIIEASLWLGTVFFAAADPHIEYLVLLFPVMASLLVVPPAWFPRRAWTYYALFLGLLCFSVSAAKWLPYLEMPSVLFIIPFPFIGLSLFLFTAGYRLWKQQDTGKLYIPPQS